MAWAFHQNLQNFGGGGDQSKIDLLIATLTHTRERFTNPIVVGGFTEITNGRTSLTQLPNLYAALKLDSMVVASVGTTALSSKSEYISIGWNSNLLLTVKTVGLIRAKSNGKFQNDTLAYDDGETSYIFPILPQGITDSRGILYIVGQDASKQNWVFGFMHNVYTVGNISLFPANLGKLASSLSATFNAKVILGGDFNVFPVGVSDRYGGRSCTASTEDGTAYWNTTLSNPYDWWYVSDSSNASNKDAILGYAIEDASTGPLALFPSDHRPILLQIK